MFFEADLHHCVHNFIIKPSCFMMPPPDAIPRYSRSLGSIPNSQKQLNLPELPQPPRTFWYLALREPVLHPERFGICQLHRNFGTLTFSIGQLISTIWFFNHQTLRIPPGQRYKMVSGYLCGFPQAFPRDAQKFLHLWLHKMVVTTGRIFLQIPQKFAEK